MRRGLVVLAAAIAAIATTLVPGSPAQASLCSPGYECHWTYYADSTHATVVGTRHVDCAGTLTTSGSLSQYATYTSVYCGD